MVSSVVLLSGAVAAWAVYSYVSGLTANIAKARKANLPYLVTRELGLYSFGYLAIQRLTDLSAVHPLNRIWQVTFWIWVPLIKLLPKSLWESWLL